MVCASSHRLRAGKRSTVQRIRSRSAWLKSRSPIQNGGSQRDAVAHRPDAMVRSCRCRVNPSYFGQSRLLRS